MKMHKLGSTKNIIIKYDFIDSYAISSIQKNLSNVPDSEWMRTRANFELSRNVGLHSILDYGAMNDSICEVASYEYGINLVPYGSGGNIHLWEKGDVLECHSDSESEHCQAGPIKDYIHSGWPQVPIQISALIYLNDDYKGGKIKFTYHGITVDPQPGMLLLFPSTCMYPHEVLRIESGKRYTYNVFLSSKSLVDSFIELRTLVQ